jgi:hypothetical protein
MSFLLNLEIAPFVPVYSFVDSCINYKVFEENVTKLSEYKKNIIKRVICIAIPFLCLYKPIKIIRDSIKNLLLIGKNGYTLLKRKISPIKKVIVFSSTLAKVSLFIFAFFSFKVGLIVSGTLFVFKAAVLIPRLIKLEKYKKAFHKTLSFILKIGVISVLILGSLKLSIALIIFKIVLTIYKAGYEFAYDKIPEGIFKIAKVFFSLNKLSCKITKLI